MGGFEPKAKPWKVDPALSTFRFELLGENWDQIEILMTNAIHRTPCLETAEIKMLLNGPESFTPDGHRFHRQNGATKSAGPTATQEAAHAGIRLQRAIHLGRRSHRVERRNGRWNLVGRLESAGRYLCRARLCAWRRGQCAARWHPCLCGVVGRRGAGQAL